MLNTVPAGARPPEPPAAQAASPGRHALLRFHASLGLYAAVARGAFRRHSTYRAATLAGVFTNTVFGCILAYTFVALWQARPGLGGYDVSQAVTFIWVCQGLMPTTAIFGGGFEDDLQTRFRNGDIAVDLYRPVDFLGWWLASDLGRAGYHLLVRGGAPLLIGSLLFHFRLPERPLTWLVFLLSALLAELVSFGLRFLVALTGFWLHDSEGVRSVTLVVTMFLSGMLLPLTLFPGGLADLARVLPWATLAQVPADLFLEHTTGSAVLGPLGLQLGWAAVLLAAGRGVQALATRKVVVQGG
ncbi:ABC transporter permease [Kitasatospora sp. NPDC001547]|uniref:ABC transporter permease n=1 Tax=Kitasatospora sp. NPDC001547 TaxID=3364015 RepID=UPI00367EECCA